MERGELEDMEVGNSSCVSEKRERAWKCTEGGGFFLATVRGVDCHTIR